MIPFSTFKALVQKRRSVYPQTFLKDKVDDKEIIELLELANWAPNHKKTEPWRFKIFTDESLKGLSELFSDFYLKHTPKEKYSSIKHKKLTQKPLQCSHVIFIIMKRSTVVDIPEWEEIAAVSCAVQNFWLGCATKSIGAYWSSPTGAIKQDNFLNLKEDEIYLGQLYVGRLDPDLTHQASRGHLAEKLTWVRS